MILFKVVNLISIKNRNIIKIKIKKCKLYKWVILKIMRQINKIL